MGGTFLMGPITMTLLAAVTLDGNNKTLPLAWAIVPGESTEHWSWLLEHLGQAFPSMRSPGQTLISDRGKGIENAVEKHFPLAYHCYYSFHLANVVQTRYGQVCRKLFWKAVYATTESAFNDALKEMGEQKEACKTYLEGISPQRWAVHACPAKRYGHITLNMVEALNAI